MVHGAYSEVGVNMRAIQRAPTFVILIAVTGCSQPMSPEDRLEFTAVIEELSEAPSSPGAIGWLLVAHPEQEYPADLSRVHVQEDTHLSRRFSDGSMASISLSEIGIGERARIRIRDVELRSYPRQVFATSIVVGVPD